MPVELNIHKAKKATTTVPLSGPDSYKEEDLPDLDLAVSKESEDEAQIILLVASAGATVPSEQGMGSVKARVEITAPIVFDPEAYFDKQISQAYKSLLALAEAEMSKAISGLQGA